MHLFVLKGGTFLQLVALLLLSILEEQDFPGNMAHLRCFMRPLFHFDSPLGICISLRFSTVHFLYSLASLCFLEL